MQKDLTDAETLAGARRTLVDLFENEEWTARYREAGELGVRLAGHVIYSSADPEAFSAVVAPLAKDAETKGWASGFGVVAGKPMLVGVARSADTDFQQHFGLIALVSPVEKSALADLSTKVSATVAVFSGANAVTAADPGVTARLGSFITDGAKDSEACCAVKALGPDLKLAAFLDPTPVLADAELAASRGRIGFGVGGVVLAAVALLLGFRRSAPVPEAHAQLLRDTAAELKKSREELQRLSQLTMTDGGTVPRDLSGTQPSLNRTSISTGGAQSRYEVVAPLGEGGMARVSVVQVRGAEGFKRQFVLKRLRPELVSNQEIVAQFVDEARLGASLVHSNIVPVFDFGRDEEGYFIAQEYILGRDLDALIQASKTRRGRALEPAVVMMVAGEALKALSYAHTRNDDQGRPLGLVHRDVSPNNLMVSARGEVKLLDFGIVKSEQRLTKTQTGVVKGNLFFMSPEQARAGQVDRRSDLFSLGMTLYTALTGETLYEGSSSFELLTRAGNGLTQADFDEVADLPQGLGAVLTRALQMDPAARYADAEEFARAIAACGTPATSNEVQALIDSLLHDELASETDRFFKAST
jgi:tRNA A-37 threonylcarbamoyl transferase component Bud32